MQNTLNIFEDYGRTCHASRKRDSHSMIAIAVTAGAVVVLAFEGGVLLQTSMNWASAAVAITISVVGLLTLVVQQWIQVYRDREARQLRAEEKAETDAHRQLVLQTQADLQRQLADAKNEVKNEVTAKADETQKIIADQAPPSPPPLRIQT